MRREVSIWELAMWACLALSLSGATLMVAAWAGYLG